MGAQTCERSKWKETMRVVCIVFVAIAVAAAFDNDSVEEFQTEYDMPEESLMQVVAKLRGVVPEHMAFHVDRISHHAELMQTAGYEEKTKAYSHNFSSSKAAIQAALNSLTSQLQTGHNHDVAALNTSQNDNTKAINDSKTDGKSKTHGFRNKACPTKRKEMEADVKKKNAKTAMQNVAAGKICKGLGTNWGEMDIDKDTPKYGTELRNGWDKARARYVAAKTAWEQATKDHNAALAAHNTAMAAFKTALDVEVANADTACKNAHNEYAILKTEVQSNVKSRKQVYIATPSSNVTSTTLPTTVVQRFAPIRLVPRILPAGTSPPRTSASAPPRPTSLSRLAPRTGRLPPLPAPAHTGTRRTTSSSTRPCMTMTTKWQLSPKR